MSCQMDRLVIDYYISLNSKFMEHKFRNISSWYVDYLILSLCCGQWICILNSFKVWSYQHKEESVWTVWFKANAYKNERRIHVCCCERRGLRLLCNFAELRLNPTCRNTYLQNLNYNSKICTFINTIVPLDKNGCLISFRIVKIKCCQKKNAFVKL